MTTSPICSNSSAATTLRASLSMTSWPRTRVSTSTAGLAVTRSLRPPVNTSIESSSLRCRKVPKPAGGCASRSTSSLSRVIWSRASRSVSASRSFCAVTAESERCVSASRSSMPREWPGASLNRRRRSPTSASRKRTWSASSDAERPPPPDLPSDADITGHLLHLRHYPRCAAREATTHRSASAFGRGRGWALSRRDARPAPGVAGRPGGGRCSRDRTPPARAGAAAAAAAHRQPSCGR